MPRVNDYLGQALSFRSAMGQPCGILSPEVLELQTGLIWEEVQEFFEAYDKAIENVEDKKAWEDVLKELADFVFVAFQFAAAGGLELDEALNRVYESNMSKLVDGKPVKNEQGKVLKGPNYKPPFLEDLV